MARRGSRSVPSVSPIDTFEEDMLSDVIPEVSPVSRVDEFVGDRLPYDRRLFSFHEPELFRMITSGDVVQGRTVSAQRGLSQDRLAYGSPETVAICVRRKQRREVMFAKRRRGGRGGSKRWTWRSDIKC